MTGIILALISTASWALCSIIFKKLGKHLDAIGMTLITAFLSAIFLFVVILITKNNFIISKENLLLIALSGILGISIGDSLFYASLNRLSPMVFSLIMFIGPDLFSGIFGIIFLKEFPPLIVWLGIIATLLGLSFFLFPLKDDSKKSTKSTLTGIIFAIFSLICTAYSMVMVKPILNNTPILTITMYRMLFAAFSLFLFALLSKKLFIWLKILNDKMYFLKLSSSIILVAFGGFYLSLLALKYCSLVVTSAIMSLGPLFVFIFMIMFYKYKPKKREYLGVLFVIFGIILICLGHI